MKTSKQITGIKGEKIAVAYLQKKHYRILNRNLRIGRAEIDIVAERDNELVFIEVKTRTTENFGYPETFVTDKQKTTLMEAASSYTADNKDVKPIRFDIISIILESRKSTLSHFEDAFWYTA